MSIKKTPYIVTAMQGGKNQIFNTLLKVRQSYEIKFKQTNRCA